MRKEVAEETDISRAITVSKPRAYDEPILFAPRAACPNNQPRARKLDDGFDARNNVWSNVPNQFRSPESSLLKLTKPHTLLKQGVAYTFRLRSA